MATPSYPITFNGANPGQFAMESALRRRLQRDVPAAIARKIYRVSMLERENEYLVHYCSAQPPVIDKTIRVPAAIMFQEAGIALVCLECP